MRPRSGAEGHGFDHSVGMSEYASGRAERCLFSFRPPEQLGFRFSTRSRHRLALAGVLLATPQGSRAFTER